MVHPLGKRPRGWFGPEDYNDGDDIAEETAARARKQLAWDEIFYKMSWWKRLCCVMAGEVTEPMNQVPYAFFENKLQRQQTAQPAPHIQPEENSMKNEELLQRRGSRLNSFTRTLRNACIEQGTVLVKLRNGDMCRVKYLPADANNEEFEHPYDDAVDGGFLAAEGYSYWQANGESITGDRFDIVEFDPIVKPVGAGATAA
jgi:hypothetical protein